MKRSLLLLGFVLGSGTALWAQEATEKQAYLVATRRPVRNLEAVLDRVPSTDRFESFESVNGFAAQLTAAEVAELRMSPEVLFIEPDHERHAIGFEAVQSGPVAADESLEVQPVASTQQTPYGITMVDAPKLWSMARGRTIRVAVIDTGIEYTHPDLADDYKGGVDFVQNDTDPTDENGHGTHVAGTIAALDNEIGVVGVAPDVDLYAVRVLDENGNGSTSNIIRAVDWAIAHKMNVINLSLGSGSSSLLEEQAFQRAADAGILTVAASGNDYDSMLTDGLSYPAGYSTVVSVGAVDQNRAIAEFSQRGTGLNVVAPGIGVLSSTLGADLLVNGTRFWADVMIGSPRFNVEGEFVVCGYGQVGEFPAAVAGKIALIQRGTSNPEVPITFRDKSVNAKNAGAIGVVIFNNVDGEFHGTLVPPDLAPGTPKVDFIPTIGVLKSTGEMLRQANVLQISVNARSFGYTELMGTSMASPHVAGTAALIWSLAPNATAAQVKQALLDGATDMGTAGYDTVFGHGIVNAYDSAKKLAPEKFNINRRTRRARQ
jgi:serine protease